MGWEGEDEASKLHWLQRVCFPVLPPGLEPRTSYLLAGRGQEIQNLGFIVPHAVGGAHRNHILAGGWG